LLLGAITHLVGTILPQNRLQISILLADLLSCGDDESAAKVLC
jgi:hypothetical protein